MMELAKDKEWIAKEVYTSSQGHVFRFLNELNDTQRENLFSQLASIDFKSLNRLIDEHIRKDKGMVFYDFRPAPYIKIPTSASEIKRQEEARKIGEEALRDGRIACLLVAGGQGTRLGYDSPKGTFPIGPISKKSLFALHAEKILALNRRYKIDIPWYIMNSPITNTATREFFIHHDFFGLSKERVKFIVQEMLPAIDLKGRLLMDAKDHIVMSPNGHGGSLKAIKESGALEEMEREGIEAIFYFQVDNPLIKIADPVFIGYHMMEGADVSLKAIKKNDPFERLGLIAYIDGHIKVIEYSEVPSFVAEKRNQDGSLRFDIGSIGIHLFRLSFIKKEFDLPYHVAKKRIPFIDDEASLKRPDWPNGIKFERFIFDAIPFAERVVIMEVIRKEEFSPLKEEKGPSSPEVVRENIINLYADWLKEAGIMVPRDSHGRVKYPIEISPLYALDKEELIKKVEGLAFNQELYLE